MPTGRDRVSAARLRRLGALALVLSMLTGIAGVAVAAHNAPGPAMTVERMSSTGGGTGSASPGVVNVTVNLTDAPAFSPSLLAAEPGDTVAVQLVNIGALNHTFTMAKLPNVPLNRSWSPAQLDSYLAGNGTLADFSLAPGDVRFVNLTFNTTTGGDSYEFVSTVPYQFQAGMLGFLNITSAPKGTAVTSDNATNSLAWLPATLAVAATAYPIAISILVTNTGSLPHTFWLEGQSNNTLSPGNFTDYFQSHPPVVSVDVPAQPGGSVWANFTILSPGEYEYICTVPGHFANGMFGWLYVGVAPPQASSPPSTAIVAPLLLGGAGALLALGIGLTAVAAYVGRVAPSQAGPAHS